LGSWGIYNAYQCQSKQPESRFHGLEILVIL
jgi:hypothetical protein